MKLNFDILQLQLPPLLDPRDVEWILIEIAPAGTMIFEPMKVQFPGGLRYGCFFCLIFLLLSVVGCASRTETRIRNYFGMAKGEPLEETTIRAALLQQFPIGTPSTTVETSLALRGLGKDGKSMIWRPQTDRWHTNNVLCCKPVDYTQHSFSVFPMMRRLTVCFDLDDQQKVKQINVWSLNYGL